MDPVTAAGLGISITSLALQLFSGCIKGYQLLLEVVDMPAKFEHLRVRMRLEQVRLLNWGEKVGLLEDVLEEPSLTLQLHRNLIFDILMEVQRLFSSCLKIETQYNLLVSVNKEQNAQNRTTASPRLGSKRTSALLEKALRVLERSTEIPKRLKWAMVKQEKFESLIEGLIKYNDSMVCLLDRVAIQEIHNMQTQSQLIMLQLSSQINELRQLTQALQVKTTEDRPASLQLPIMSGHSIALNHQLIHNEEQSLARLAMFKADRIEIESDTSQEGMKHLNASDVEIGDSYEGKDLGRYQDRHVWVEWKGGHQHAHIPSWLQMIESRVFKLAALLGIKDKPTEFRAPKCLGCFRDPDPDMVRFGLVYEMPDIQTDAPRPTSLWDWLQDETKPSLTQRIGLASALASGLMYLHSVSWLHKGIRSQNILFFAADDSKADFSSPVISGFEFARPDLSHEITEKPEQNVEHDIYRHPQALAHTGTRSKKSWDIYSLGIILIEIAFWQSIEAVVRIDLTDERAARSKVRRVRSVLLEEATLLRIGALCGERYQEVVRRCISGGTDLGIQEGSDESDPVTGAEMLDVFGREVAGVLQGLQL